MSRSAVGRAALAALALAGCEARSPERAPEPERLPEHAAAAELPDALLVRFQTASGPVLDGEGWEIEILQMGADVRVRGAVRTGGTSAPIYRGMTETEYADFWQWISAFPLDGHRVEEDASAPQEGWRKTCKIDVVLGPERRLLAENRWTRPLLSPAWMQALETRLHSMALDYAEEALAQPAPAGEDTVEIDEGMRRALEALGEKVGE
jgi:hypothetical protein